MKNLFRLQLQIAMIFFQIFDYNLLDKPLIFLKQSIGNYDTYAYTHIYNIYILHY